MSQTLSYLNIDELAHRLELAKQAEQQAKDERLAIEALLIDKIGVREEGTTTFATSQYTIKTVGKLTRSLDETAIKKDWDTLPEAVQKCINWKPSVDTKNLRALESMREDLVPTLAKYMTVKPAKASVSVTNKMENAA